MEVLYQSLKQNRHGEDISFDEFVKGVMDFPFLLEQFQQELEGLEPGAHTGKRDLFIDIDCIEEEPLEENQSSHAKSHQGSREAKAFRFSAQSFENPGRPFDSSLLIQAYCKFAYLSKQSLDSQAAPTPSSSQGEELAYDELIQRLDLALSKIQGRFQLTEQANLVTLFAEGTRLLAQQLEETVKSYDQALSNSQSKLEAEIDKTMDLERRCEMAETSYALLFDRLRTVEEEMKQEHSQTEQIQQETFRLRDLLKSEKAQGAIVSNELAEIQNDITEKEEQISRLQRELRRLTSRKVLHETSSGHEGALEVRLIRKERMSTSYNLSYKEHSSVKSQAVPSPSSSISRISESKQMNLLNALLSEKQRQIKDSGKALQEKQRQLEKWEYQLKCRETDLESCVSVQMDQLRQELENTRKRLFSEQNKNKQLELSLNDVSRCSVRLETTEALGEVSRFNGGLEFSYCDLTVENLGIIGVLPSKLAASKAARRVQKEDCCSFF